MKNLKSILTLLLNYRLSFSQVLLLGLIVFGNGLSVAVAQPTESDSLFDSYIHESWQNHPDLQSMKSMVDAANQRTAMSQAWMNPEVNFGLMNSPTTFDTHMDPATAWQIGFEQQIPFPGKLQAARDAGEAQTRAAVATVEEGRYTMASMVAMAYYDLAGAISIRKALERGRDLNREIMDAASIMVSSGMGSRTDILRAKMDLEQWNVKLVNNQADIKRKQAELAYAVGRSDEKSLAMPVLPDSLPPSLDLDQALADNAVENTPTLVKSKEELAGATAEQRKARLSYWPDVKLMVNYGIRGWLRTGGGLDAMTGLPVPLDRMKQDNMISIGIAAPIPLFYRGNQRAQIRELDAMRTGRGAEHAKARLAKEEELRKLYARWQETADCCRLALAKIVPLAEDTWQSTLVDYRAGKAPFMALTEARMGVVMADMEQIMHRADAWIAYQQFYAAQGKLAPDTAETHSH
jgi:outer membrane protein TolC